MPDPVVGRDPELAAAERFLAAIQDGPAALVLEGEQGIGKTTIWLEVVRRAQERGCRVLLTRPAAAEAKLGFSGLGDLLGEIDDRSYGRLPDRQRQALEIALARAEGTADRLALFSGVVGLITAVSEERPVVLAIDDLQWLDAPSTAALEFAVRRLAGRPVGLLASLRSGTRPRVEALEQALAGSTAIRVRVGPLSIGALHHVLKKALGRPLPRPLVVGIERAAGGNPFFAIEIAREIAERGTKPGEPLPVPDDVRRLLAARVRRLPASAREALLTAAALSRPTTETVDADALGPAEDAGLVRVDTDGRIQFAHPFYGSAVYASASVGRRRELHRRLAALAVDPEERARHLALATNVPDAEVADALDGAAEHARSRGGPDAAAELLELAIRLTPIHLAETRVRRELARGTDLAAAGQTGRAREAYERAAAEAPAGALRSDALVYVGWICVNDGEWSAAVEQFERALAEADSPEQRGLVHRALAWVNTFVDLERASAHGRAALELVDERDEPGAYSWALLNLAWTDLLRGEVPREDDFARGIALQERFLPTDWTLSWVPAFWPLGRDELALARTRLDRPIEVARREGDDLRMSDALRVLALVEFYAGNWRCAQEAAERSLELAESMPLMTATLLAVRMLVDAGAGRIEQVREGWRLLTTELAGRADPGNEATGAAALGLLELSLGNHAAADHVLTLAGDVLEGIGMREPARHRFQGDAIEAAVAVGALERAEEGLARLDRRARTFPHPWTLAIGARCRGLLLATRGDLDRALSQLDEALGHHGQLGMPFELARTLLVKGEIHRRRREKRLAKDAFDRAGEIFEALPAPLWAERARIGSARVRSRSGPVDLTETERQIAELAAGGATNKEIAATLFMSPKTVEKRLASVYRKLGIRSRAELGARMAERRAPAKA